MAGVKRVFPLGGHGTSFSRCTPHEGSSRKVGRQESGSSSLNTKLRMYRRVSLMYSFISITYKAVRGLCIVDK